MRYFGCYKQKWYCRWCGKVYVPVKGVERDGFCCNAHEMALHRARKKYVSRPAGDVGAADVRVIGGKLTNKATETTKRKGKK